MLITAMGLWWTFLPNKTIGFYRALGNRQFEQIGVAGVRVMGILVLTVMATLGLAFAWKGLL